MRSQEHNTLKFKFHTELDITTRKKRQSKVFTIRWDKSVRYNLKILFCITLCGVEELVSRIANAMNIAWLKHQKYPTQELTNPHTKALHVIITGVTESG